METIRVLMVDNTCSVGWNLKRGLEQLGHQCTLICDEHTVHSGTPDALLSEISLFSQRFDAADFDLIHVHGPKSKKLLQFFKVIKKVPLVCHWHGTGLRMLRGYHPLKYLCNKYAKAHLYSTMDLRWFINLHFTCTNVHPFYCPIDTELFSIKNTGERKELLEMDLNNKPKIPHDEMPELYNQYQKISMNHNADSRLLNVTAMEAACCGCVFDDIEYLSRDWVLNHATIESQAKKALEIYEGVIEYA